MIEIGHAAIIWFIFKLGAPITFLVGGAAATAFIAGVGALCYHVFVWFMDKFATRVVGSPPHDAGYMAWLLFNARFGALVIALTFLFAIIGRFAW